MNHKKSTKNQVKTPSIPKDPSLEQLLKSPALALGLAPLLFGLSQIVILGYNWIFKGYAGNLSLTVSRYVGLNLWTSILFAIFNTAITIIMFRYYLSLRKSRSTLWFILGCLESLSFLALSFFPHNTFIEDPGLRELVCQIHVKSAHVMFVSMFGMAIETFRLSRPNHLKLLQNLPLLKSPKRLLIPKNVAPICIAFIAYGVFYFTVYLINWTAITNHILILESGYIYAFMAFLILTRKIRTSDIEPLKQ
ncbi:hypothetical protein IKD57_01425 [Candidatus Saccharibacteria bacterium]|nr:hypothetical protein [Candidatus Saccharibacteria bacterium]